MQLSTNFFTSNFEQTSRAPYIHEHILQEDILPECQWGFLSGKSTTTALLATTYEWHKHLEAGVEICGVFLYLQNAFDSLPHRNLLHIMKHIGIHPIILKWTCSYLTYRTQRVVVDGVISSEVHALSGVPQGSWATTFSDIY